MSEADFAALAGEYGVRTFMTAQAAALLDQPAQAIGSTLGHHARARTTIELAGRVLRLVKAGRAAAGYHRWRFELVAVLPATDPDEDLL